MKHTAIAQVMKQLELAAFGTHNDICFRLQVFRGSALSSSVNGRLYGKRRVGNLLSSWEPQTARNYPESMMPNLSFQKTRLRWSKRREFAEIQA